MRSVPPLPKKISAKLVTTCDQLTIGQFVRCLYDNDLSALVIEGKPTDQQLAEAWSEIFEEYSVLTENEQYGRLVKAMKDFLRNSAKMLVIRGFLISVQYNRYNRDQVLAIKKIGYTLKLDPADADGWMRDINQLIAIAKTLKIKCDMGLDEIDRIKKENEGKDSGGKEVFMDGMIIIGKWLGYRIDPAAVTVSEYARMQKQYNVYCDRQAAINRKGK